MQKKWKYLSAEVKNSEDFSKIKQFTKSDLLAQLLISRGIDTAKKVKEYLDPLKMEFASPYEFTDMDIAVERIFKAVENGEKILVHGDFDADGITSTALLSKLLNFLKADFDIYIPNRETESHGLSTKAILPKVSKDKVKLVISCDCAVSNVKEVKLLKTFGVDTIITDHHEPAETLPEAIAIIDAKVNGKVNEKLDASKIKHLSDLAGVGVAFKLALAILEKTGQQNFAQELLPLVAVGTVADVVPVLGENRAFIKMGLEEIINGKNKGLSKLLEISGVEVKNGLTSDCIAFQIAPRINATGRLDTADEAFKLLTSDNMSEIEFLCHELNNKNSMRQAFCDKIFKEAIDLYETSQDKNEFGIVLYQEDWHLGVIGIVASKIAEKYNKPVFMMCKDPNSDIIRSSIRSIEGVNVFELLSEMKDYFVSFGGHKGAAGLSFDPKEYSFETVKQKIFELTKKYSQGLDLTPVLKVDLKVQPDDLTLDFVESLSILEPCGMGNSYPVFSIEDLKLQNQKLIGQKQNHLKFVCVNEKKETLDCVYWNNPLLDIVPESRIDIAFYPKINVFNNVTSLQLDIQDAHYEELKKDFNIYDHRNKQDILPLVCDFVCKNVQKVFIYIKNSEFKNQLLKIGFPENSFILKDNVSHLMFFDYPDSINSMKCMVETICPKNLHFMHPKTQNLSLEDFINRILGMIKYATHNKNGEFDIKKVSAAIGMNEDIIKSTLELLSEADAIKILSENNYLFIVEYLRPISFDMLEKVSNFDILNDQWNEIINFKEQILSLNEKELAEILK